MKILILITAFNVEKFLENVISRIPSKIKKFDVEILIIDDSSSDQTLQKMKDIKNQIKDYKITCLSNKKNLGYGGNQKIGYHYAIKNNFDLVILLHGDGQYAPEKVFDMLNPLLKNEADAVQGSRMINKLDALKGRMPYYKFFGNISLTFLQNFLSGLKLSEYHSGYRAYRVNALKEIPFDLNSNYFHFDTQILLQFKLAKKKIKEISIPTFYGEQISSLNSIKYGFAILNTTIIFFLQKFGLFHDVKYDFLKSDGPENYLSKLDFDSTHSFAYKNIKENSNVLSVGCGCAHLEKKLIDEKKCIVDGIDNTNIPNLDFLNSFKVIDFDKEIFSIDIKKYDYILLLDVIEHLKKPEDFMKRLNYEMGFFPNKKLILSTPNVANIFMRFNLLIGNFNYGRRGILDRTHTRLFTLNSLKKIINEHNFKIDTIIPVQPPFPLVVKNKFISDLLMKLFKYLNFLSKSLFAFQFLTISKADPNLDYLLEQAKINEK